MTSKVKTYLTAAVAIAIIYTLIKLVIFSWSDNSVLENSSTYSRTHWWKIPPPIAVRESGYYKSVLVKEFSFSHGAALESSIDEYEKFKVKSQDVIGWLDRELTENPPTYLVYLCDAALDACGDWTGKQLGLAFVYHLSRLVERRFKIVIANPCDISQFYATNRVDWVARDGELTTPTKSNTIDTITSQGRGEFYSNIRSGDFNVKYPQRIIYIKANQDLLDEVMKNPIYHQRLEDTIFNTRGRFRWTWPELMKPSALLLSELKHILGHSFLIKKHLLPASENPRKDSMYDVGESKLICAHVASGPSTNVTEDSIDAELKELSTLHEFLSSKDRAGGGGGYFFIATDSINVHRQSQGYFKQRYVDYGSKTLHRYDLGVKLNECDLVSDVVTNQAILSLCHVLVVSNTAFGRMAYLMTNLTDNVYIMENGVIRDYKG